MSSDPNNLPNLAGGKPAGQGTFLLSRRHRLCQPFLDDAPGHLLDYGCGNGAQTLLFADDFAHIQGVDVEPDFLATFQDEIQKRKVGDTVQAILFDGAGLPQPDNTFDTALTFTVLEHVPDDHLALREIRRVLRPGGRLIVSVPNKWWIFETHGANLPLLPWNRVPLVSWWPKPWHDRFARARIYRLRELIAMVRKAGFEVEHAFRQTAPMDVARPPALRDWLQRTIFAADRTKIPFLATENYVVAKKL